MKKKMIKWLAICFVFLAWTDCAQGETMASGDDFVQEQLIGQMDFEGLLKFKQLPDTVKQFIYIRYDPE